MERDLFQAGGVAVVTGAALGIGRAAALRFARLGLSVVMVDLDGADLEASAEAVKAVAAPGRVLVARTDVTDPKAMASLAARASATFAPPNVVMANAVSRAGGDVFADRDGWRTAFDVNVWGVLNTVDAFAPAMIKAGKPGAIITAGSKQGITNPPGNAAYNATKAALKSYTESLSHHLRTATPGHVTAHLLVPGWTTTGKREHKPGAWLPDQVLDWMMPRVNAGSFYIVCPDDEVTPDMDRKRILWSAMDITEDRPALSRWHGGYGDAFDAFEPPPRRS